MEAIFTAARPKTGARFVIGIVSILVGISLWLIVGLRSGPSSLFGTSSIGPFFSTLLPEFGLILVITGAGMCLSFPILGRRGRQERSADIEDATLAQEVPSDRNATSFSTDHGGPTPAGVLMTRNLRFGLVAFFQGCAVLALYSGLVDDYRSNLSMELWIRSNLPFGQYLLNSLTGLVIAAVLGLTMIQFLPGRLFAE